LIFDISGLSRLGYTTPDNIALNNDSTLTETIYYKFGSHDSRGEFNESQKNSIRNGINQSMDEEDHIREFIENNDNVYWTIVPRTYHTNTNYTNFSTWFGTLTPGISARSEPGTDDYNGLVHEKKELMTCKK